MKALGILLLVVGSLWALVAFNADTTVSTESQFIGSTYIPSQKVHNIGKMDERRNHLMLSALAVVVGVILFAVGKVKTPPTPSQSDINPYAGNRKCPFCAEFVKTEAVICRFCQKDLPPIPEIAPAPDITESNNTHLPTSVSMKSLTSEQIQAMEEFGITYDGEKFHFSEYRYDRLNDAVNYAKLQVGKK